MSVAALLALSMVFTPSCIGSFTLTNRLLGWNKTVGNKFINELVFFAFWVLPVYEVSALADVLVLNSIEFWSGRNPMTASATRTVEGSNGVLYAISADETGYDVVNLSDESSMRLEYCGEDNSWNVEINGERHVLFTFVDDTHIAVPMNDGGYQVVEASQAGVNLYASEITARYMARN